MIIVQIAHIMLYKGLNNTITVNHVPDKNSRTIL